jgi:uncharacterized membrane protein
MIPGSFIWKRIGDEWLDTKAASGLFGASAFVIVAVTPIWFGYVTIPDTTLWANVFLGISGVVGALSVFFLWSGMWRYWMQCDASTRGVKRAWFLVLLIGFWYGAILYYLLAYLPRKRKGKIAPRAREAK